MRALVWDLILHKTCVLIRRGSLDTDIYRGKAV